VADRHHAGIDVKMIMSEFEITGCLEQLQALGINVVTTTKIQDNVHNKGMIVDATTVLVSSQNWSTASTLHNRDAGVIIANPDVAHYFQQIFLHDWENLARQSARRLSLDPPRRSRYSGAAIRPLRRDRLGGLVYDYVQVA
jgi:phosphatidylserine/phosphatidylglycerophosphate/cardiolipin synthase-like enzyme